MSTTTIKLFIFFVLIIKIVNCGICFGKPQVYEGNNYVVNHGDNDDGFQGFEVDEIQDFESDLGYSSTASACFTSDNDYYDDDDYCYT
uniref:Uncharacterized protein n=1 Tax=Meloidogyne enterolobii TaxID=390850 RepID=A0A6V7XFJ1_MELEN|nr:unnamed protein product [Meloidogyne enterolobii]